MKSKIFSIVMLFGMLCTLNLTAQEGLLQGKRIFLDPGHDGFTSGDRNIATINFPVETTTGWGNDGFYESKMNVWRAFEIERLLEYHGAIVDMTRRTTPTNPADPWYRMSLSARVTAAHTFNADVYSSIHSNAHDGMANHPLVLWDTRSNPIHPQTQQLARDLVWWIADNPLTSWDRTPVNRQNVRGGLFGAVLTNRMPSVLTEDTFHDYRPEAHRYLSLTYNHMISFGHLRGFMRFFGHNHYLHPTGMIMGWVKDNTRSITANFPPNGHRFLPFRERSHDAYWPINGATIELLQNGIVIDTYTVDNNWNGVFGFIDLAPGDYQVRISARGYVTATQNLTVAAGEITAANQILALCDPNDPDCEVIFPPLRLVVGTEAEAPFGTHVTTADVGITSRLYLGIDANNDENNPSWDNRALSTLTSTNQNVARISSAGVITLRAAGTTTLRAIRNSDGATGTIEITVTGVAPVLPLEVVSYDPQGVQEESARPIVRLEFNRPLNQATLAGKLTVTNESGRVVAGTQSYHAAANGKSVIHYIFSEDLIPQAVYTVTLTAGIEGTDGSDLAEDFTFTFTARPRNTNLVTVVDNFNTFNDPPWFQPTRAGQTVGVVAAATNAATDNSRSPHLDHPSSVRLNYQWDEITSSPFIRWHHNVPAQRPRFATTDNHIQYYLFGDGSGTRVAIAIRDGDAGSFFAHNYIALDWVGWKRISWDMRNDPFWRPIVGGSDPMPATMAVTGFVLAPTTGERENTPSSMNFSRVRVVGLGDFIERDAHTLTFGVVAETEDESGTLVAATVAGYVTSGEQVLHGKDVIFSAFPSEGYLVKAWFVNGAEVPNETGSTFTLVNLTADTEVMVEFEADSQVGIESIFSAAQIFPNPFTDAIQIVGAENSILQVTDVLGAVVHTQQITEANENIHLGALPAGVYFFRVERDGQAKTMKVVKQ